MGSISKGVIIFILVILVWGCGFALFYFFNGQWPQHATSTITTTTTSTTESTTTTQTTPGLTSDERFYIETLDYYDEIVMNSVNKLNSLLASPSISNSGWIEQIENEGGILVALYSPIAQIPTPGNMVAVQKLYLNVAMYYYNLAVQYVITGINNADTTYISTAIGYIGIATDARNEAINAINDYISSFN
jgi:hypothetical protein